ncbi:MAG TPA: glycosyltransferase [Candidatus Paceibacterota bacterium]|nr:glycosyltransferase [Candidatus Paceibacterota bacterium]
MRALFISNDPLLFDAASTVRTRMRAYARAIGELHIVSLAPRGSGEAHEEALHLYPVHGSRLFRTAILAARARALIESKHIEIVSAQDPFEHGRAALRAVQGTAAKLHVQVHTDFLSPWFTRGGNWRAPQVRMPFLNRFRRRMADGVLPQAHGIRVVSERVKQSLVARYGSRIPEPSVIPIAVDATVPEPVALPPRPFTFTLITVARLEPEKRIEDILAALTLVAPHYPVAGLVIVGEGRERRQLERLARSFGIRDKVVFLGARSDAWGLMRSAQAFIQASAYEGYSRTLMEAALAKIPIITTDVGIVGEVFTGYEDVLAAPVADPTALSYHIVGLIEDMEVRLSLPMHAEAKARAHLATQGDVPARIAADLQKAIG